MKATGAPRSDRPPGTRLGVAVALAMAVAAIGVAMRWGAFVAGGSDSYCYVAQAGMWLDGSLLRPFQPGLTPFWSHADLSFAPVGFVPSPHRLGSWAPICPPGLALVMAAFQALAGGRVAGAFAVVPLCGALTVWCAFVLGRRMAGITAGLMAAAATLASPIFLFQVLQPMSDVPATAFWLAALAAAAAGPAVRGSRIVAGSCTAVAVLVRPNLAPLAAVIAFLAVMAEPPGTPRRTRLRALLWFGACALPGPLAVAGLNHVLYGSPLRSGYGDPGLLFAWSHVAPNLARYPRWLLDTHTPAILVGALAPFLVPGRHSPDGGASPRVAALAALAMAVTVFALYVSYVVFEDWNYLRFLLPGVVLLLVQTSAVVVHALRRLPSAAARSAVAGVLVVAFAWFGVSTARERGVFRLHLSEARFVDAASWVREHLPADAVVLSVWHSGSVRMYGQRLTVLWDALEPGELSAIADGLADRGHPTYLLVESWEVPAFRDRFSSVTPLAALDWPPRAQVGREVAVYDLADRARYFGGERVPTTRVWTSAERSDFRHR